jgi:hypothetical protein
MRLASLFGPLRRFNLAHPKLLIRLCGCFRPHHLCVAVAGRWDCGNRGAISKSSGKIGKPVLGFPAFHLRVISRAFGLGLFVASLLFVVRSPEAVRFGARLQNVSSIRDAIEQRLTKASIRNDLRPFRER